MTSSSIGDTQVLSLAKLIYETAGKIVQQYNSTGHSVPSLDSTDVGPFDAPGKIPPELARNMRIIEGACAQLSIAVNRPSHVITNKGYYSMEVSCLRVVHDAKVADYLVDKPDGMHVNDLGPKCGLDPVKLARVLRLLATAHCFREVKPDVFANNRISTQLCSDNPVSSLVGFLADEATIASCHLSDAIRDPEFASSLSPDHNAFIKAFGVNSFAFYSSPPQAKRHERFAKAMVGFAEVTGKFLIAKAIPWGSAPKGSTICDIAGGNGHITLDLAKEFPNIHVVVQDLPKVVEQARQFWSENLPEAVQTERVKFVELDFFKESPVPNCRWYFIRHSLHDWPDSECVKILLNIRKVMSSDSRLLINEFILQHAVREENEAENDVDQAPEPMLANYGQGRIRPYEQDILMMTLLNSQERKLHEFVSIAEKAGFKYEGLHDSGEAKIVEFSPV